jgi:hypothetical protein
MDSKSWPFSRRFGLIQQNYQSEELYQAVRILDVLAKFVANSQREARPDEKPLEEAFEGGPPDFVRNAKCGGTFRHVGRGDRTEAIRPARCLVFFRSLNIPSPLSIISRRRADC